MRPTLQYIYILLKDVPLNVTVTSARLENNWIHLLRLNFVFHSPHRLYLLKGLGTLSRLLPPAGTSEGGETECFFTKHENVKADGYKLQNVSSTLTTHYLKSPSPVHYGATLYP